MRLNKILSSARHGSHNLSYLLKQASRTPKLRDHHEQMAFEKRQRQVVDKLLSARKFNSR